MVAELAAQRIAVDAQPFGGLALVAAGLTAPRARVLLVLAAKAAGVNYGPPHTQAAEAAAGAGLVVGRMLPHYTTRAGRLYTLSAKGEVMVAAALRALEAYDV